MILRWRDATGSGLEHVEISEEHGFISAKSVVIGPSQDPFAMTYELVCDTQWRTKSLDVKLLNARHALSLRTDGFGHWTSGRGEMLTQLNGCLDVDITATPLTNTLPVRRLKLDRGQRAEIRVVYVQIPDLTVTVSVQTYTRLSEKSYRFESPKLGFVSDIEFDGSGFVLHYPGLFERVCRKCE